MIWIIIENKIKGNMEVQDDTVIQKHEMWSEQGSNQLLRTVGNMANHRK